MRKVRNDVTPSSLSALFVVTVVEERSREGAGDREKDEPIAGGEF